MKNQIQKNESEIFIRRFRVSSIKRSREVGINLAKKTLKQFINETSKKQSKSSKK